MDNKAWLWRKKTSEKTIVAGDKADINRKPIEEKVKMLSTEKELDIPVMNLKEKLASVIFDCDAKEVLVAKHVKMAEEAIADKEKLEGEAVILKRELDEALREAAKANERLSQSDATLKKQMQQVRSLREEQEQRICDAIMTTTKEFEKAQKVLEEKSTEIRKRQEISAVENTNLREALLAKQKIIEDLHRSKSEAEAEFNAVMARLDSTEKENGFLKYEFQVLEKEFDIRNVEMDICRRSADASHNQHLETVKKVTKLEAECQRLRLLVRKRLPGPAAIAKMKSEVEMLGKNRRDNGRKHNPSRDLIVRSAPAENCPEFSSNKMSVMIERLHEVEKENKTLRDIITKKNGELHSSCSPISRTAFRLSEAETNLGELSKRETSLELARYSPISTEHSQLTGFDMCSDDQISSSGSWANALISELEHFRNKKVKRLLEHRAMDVSELSLMDDFEEMEKLAIFSDTKQHIKLRNSAAGKSFDWLQVVLDAMTKQTRVSKQSMRELLEDIRIALGFVNHSNTSEADAITTPKHSGEPDQICGYITWKSPSSSPAEDLPCTALSIGTSEKETSNQQNQSGLSQSVGKIIKLIEGFNPQSLISDNTTDNLPERDQSLSPLSSTLPSEYTVRVFQWRSSELRVILQQFDHTCRELLNGKVDVEFFVDQLSFALDRILNNHSYPKDASTMMDMIKKQLGESEPQDEKEVVVRTSEKQSPSLPSASLLSDYDQFDVQYENRNLEDELTSMQSSKIHMEAPLQSTTDKSEALMIQLKEEYEQRIECLHAEMETLRESKGTFEDQIENQKSINEDLATQLLVTKAKLNEVRQKFSSLEVELEDKRNCCEELEGVCLELQLQLESVRKKEIPSHGKNVEEKQSQTGRDITAASLKLVECQETILNLGKQLKALASPREAALFDKVFSSTTAPTTVTNKSFTKHSTLYEQMQAEDSTVHKSPKEYNISTIDAQKPYFLHTSNSVLQPAPYLGSKHNVFNPANGGLTIVPLNKQGGSGFLRKLLMRKKKSKKYRSFF